MTKKVFNQIAEGLNEALEEAKKPTPSMDDKDTPSPPVRTVEDYHADCQLGIQRIGKPQDKKGL